MQITKLTGLTDAEVLGADVTLPLSNEGAMASSDTALWASDTRV